MGNSISIELVANKILTIRGKKIMLDRTLAQLYGVSTKVLNQAVKRNISRFPKDFMFRLTAAEKEELVTNCDQFNTLKHSTSLPYAFTEQGIAMLSSVLNSERAIQVNILIMRIFTRLRDMFSTHKELATRLEELEIKYAGHDEKIKVIFEALKKLLEPPPVPEKPRIGFHPHR